MNQSVVLAINSPSHVGLARRHARVLAQSLSFTETLTGSIEIAVSEAATNIVIHAGHGTIILRAIGAATLEMLAFDKGPGMADVDRCLRDGFSTAGSSGTGLGAITRLSQVFDVYSHPQHGTVIFAHFCGDKRHKASDALTVGVVRVAMSEDEPCGDDWAILEHSSRTQILMVDGIGHGILAAQAAERATETFRKSPYQTPVDYLQSIHGPLRSTRGGAVAVAEIDYTNGLVRYAGVGNIAGTIITDGKLRSMVSHNGTLGHELHRVQEFQYPWEAKSTMVLHSDGLMSRWKLDGYPGLESRHPAVIAAVLYRDYQRGRDDVTVLVGRSSKQKAGNSVT